MVRVLLSSRALPGRGGSLTASRNKNLAVLAQLRRLWIGRSRRDLSIRHLRALGLRLSETHFCTPSLEQYARSVSLAHRGFGDAVFLCVFALFARVRRLRFGRSRRDLSIRHLRALGLRLSEAHFCTPSLEPHARSASLAHRDFGYAVFLCVFAVFARIRRLRGVYESHWRREGLERRRLSADKASERAKLEFSLNQNSDVRTGRSFRSLRLHSKGDARSEERDSPTCCSRLGFFLCSIN